MSQWVMISDIARQYLGLHLAPHVGPTTFAKLMAHFSTVDGILKASNRELRGVDGIGPRTAEAIRSARGSEHADAQIRRAEQLGVSIVCIADREYPAPLRHINDPPICLYQLGSWQREDTLALAIVGTRRCSHYGREQALRFAELVGRAGFTVVSGLARGVDGHAHEGALRAGGRTIAVLGNGLPEIYPIEHVRLAKQIAERGALISEIPLDSAPEPHNFPRRNRLVAGLCLGTIVVEAGLRSGALITARCASDYNREVFAVPGRVDLPELSSGTNGLIRDGGAKLITCLEDVLDELGDVGAILAAGSEMDKPEPPPISKLPRDEQAILNALDAAGADIESISAAAHLPMDKTAVALTSLQLKSLITRLSGNRFARRV